MQDFFAIAALALLLESAGGYPSAVYQRIGHPVTWIGGLLSCLEALSNRPHWSTKQRRLAGLAALLVLLATCASATLTLQWGAGLLPWGLKLGVLALLAASLPAQRSLYDHVARVAEALERAGLAAGRAAVSEIVGRDPEALDEAGVARAAIESLAENFSDGVVAPAFWLAAGGLPGGVLYKAINTADSMIGHRNSRYRDFGWAAARLDDLVNLPASRLAAAWITTAAVCTPGARAGEALSATRRDAGRHRSPNAGWPEAAMAGALGLRLAGPRVYDGKQVDDAFMGNGCREAGPADIRAALRLYRNACRVQLAVLLAGAAILWLS